MDVEPAQSTALTEGLPRSSAPQAAPLHPAWLCCGRSDTARAGGSPDPLHTEGPVSPNRSHVAVPMAPAHAALVGREARARHSWKNGPPLTSPPNKLRPSQSLRDPGVMIQLATRTTTLRPHGFRRVGCVPLPLVGMEGRECPAQLSGLGRDESDRGMDASRASPGRALCEVRAKESPPGRQPPGLPASAFS